MKLSNHRMNDSSRWFATLPMRVYPEALRDHLARLGGVAITAFVSAMPADGSWIDFDYAGHRFSVNDQYGEYWFFVNDPTCPEGTLAAVATHCESLLAQPD